MKDTISNRSIQRATQILNLLSSNIHSIKDIARHSGLSTSTVHRILRALEELDWVRRDPSSRLYYLGPLVSQLTSNLVSAHKYLVTNAVDDMISLSKATGETVSLGIMMHLRYVLLHDIPSKYDLRFIERDTTGPPTQGAIGKVLLSQLKDEEVIHALHAIAAWQEVDQSEIEPGALLTELVKIRKDGYAISHGEVLAGGYGISAPIKNYVCPAALSIVGPEDRLRPNLKVIIEELKRRAEKVSACNKL